MAVTALSPTSRLLQRAQELGQLDQIIRMYVEGQTASIDLVLAGMQCGGRPPVKIAEFNTARQELMDIVERLFITEAQDLQELLFQPEHAGDMNYAQAFEMLAGGAPEPAVRAFLTGWMMGLSPSQPHIRARILARAIAQRVQGAQEIQDPEAQSDDRAMH